MLRTLIETVNRFNRPALVLWGAHVYANRQAEREFGRRAIAAVRSRLLGSGGAAARSEQPASLHIGDAELSVISLGPGDAGVAAAIAMVDPTLDDLRSLFADTMGTQSFLSRIMHLLPQIILTARPNGRIDFCNRRWTEFVGAGVFPATIEDISRALHPEDGPEFVAIVEAHISANLPFSHDARLRRSDGAYRWHTLRAHPARLFHATRVTKWLVTMSDVDEAVEGRVRLENSERRFRFLAQAGRHLSESLDVDSVARTACAQAVAGLAAAAGIAVTFEGEPALFVAEPPSAARILGAKVGLTARQSDLPWPGGLEGVHSFSRFSIAGRNRVLGTLVLGFADHGEVDREDERSLIEEFVRRVALALDNARLYAHDHRVAVTLQEALLSKELPQLDGAAFDAIYLAGDTESVVRGDWYDVFPLPDGRIGLSIGDVAGHGLHAATVMGMVRQTVRTTCYENASPAFALERANRALFSEAPTM